MRWTGMHVKDQNFPEVTKMWRIKLTDELNDDELDEFYCIFNILWKLVVAT